MLLIFTICSDYIYFTFYLDITSLENYPCKKIVNSRNNIFVSLDIMKLNIIWFRYKGISQAYIDMNRRDLNNDDLIK